MNPSSSSKSPTGRTKSPKKEIAQLGSYRAHHGVSRKPFNQRMQESYGGPVRCGYADEEWTSFAFDPSIGWFTRMAVTLVLLANHALFLYGQIAVMWRLQVKFDIDVWVGSSILPGGTLHKLFEMVTSTDGNQKVLFTFTFMESVDKLNEAGAKAAGALLFLLSGLWPHFKLLGLNLAFWLPLPARVRQVLLYYLDAFGKSSLADVMVVTIIGVGLEIPINMNLNKINITKDILAFAPNSVMTRDKVDALVSLGTYPGIYVFCGAVFLSLIMSAFIAALVKQAHVEEFGGPMARKRYDSVAESEKRARGLTVTQTSLRADAKMRPALITRSSLVRNIHPVAPYVLIILPLIIATVMITCGVFFPSLTRTVGGYVGYLNRQFLGTANVLDLSYSMWEIVLMVASFHGGSIFHAITVFIFGIACPIIRPMLLICLWLVPLSKYSADIVLLCCNFLGTFDAVWVYYIAVIIVKFEIPELSEGISIGGAQDEILYFVDYIKKECGRRALDNSTNFNFSSAGCKELNQSVPVIMGPDLPFLELSIVSNEWLVIYFIGGLITIVCSWWVSFEVSQVLFGSRYAEYPGCFCTCAKDSMYRPAYRLSKSRISEGVDPNTALEISSEGTDPDKSESLDDDQSEEKEPVTLSTVLEYVVPLTNNTSQRRMNSLLTNQQDVKKICKTIQEEQGLLGIQEEEEEGSNRAFHDTISDSQRFSRPQHLNTESMTSFEREFPNGNAAERSLEGKIKFYNTPKNKSKLKTTLPTPRRLKGPSRPSQTPKSVHLPKPPKRESKNR